MLWNFVTLLLTYEENVSYFELTLNKLKDAKSYL